MKYAGQERYAAASSWMPAYELVLRVGHGSIYEAVAGLDSLVIHTKREELGDAIKAKMQAELDRTDPATFVVSRAVVRQALTDPSIEAAIQLAVANQKKLEAMTVQTEIAKKEAVIRITESEGIAEANRIINKTLTREYLQHEANQVLMKFAEGGTASTIVIPANMQVAPLINVPAAERRVTSGAGGADRTATTAAVNGDDVVVSRDVQHAVQAVREARINAGRH